MKKKAKPKPKKKVKAKECVCCNAKKLTATLILLRGTRGTVRMIKEKVEKLEAKVKELDNRLIKIEHAYQEAKELIGGGDFDGY